MKINCPYHKDDTASMEVYPDGFAHCFGCGVHVPSSDLGVNNPVKERYVEPIEEKISYIKSLPKTNIRGLLFPADSISYYILWPDDSYYNQRFFDSSRGKYKCPSGHQKRLFWAKRSLESDTVLIVEGEINALSAAQVAPVHVDVVSPGGSGDFYSKTADKYLQNYLNYDKIVLMVDKDAAGAMAGISLKANLTALDAKDVTIWLMETDANDILVQRGKEALKAEVRAAMGMPGGL